MVKKIKKVSKLDDIAELIEDHRLLQQELDDFDKLAIEIIESELPIGMNMQLGDKPSDDKEDTGKPMVYSMSDVLGKMKSSIEELHTKFNRYDISQETALEIIGILVSDRKERQQKIRSKLSLHGINYK